MSSQNASVAGDPAEAAPAKKAFGRPYWMLNSIEMFERLAYFGIRAVVPLYIMQAGEPGGLHLTAVQKGIIYAWWAVFQSFLPIVTGGIADRYGYKRVLTFAISMNVLGYIIMANFHSYLGFFAGVLVLATGTAFFKPSLQGSIAQNLTKANSSLGWGVFYWVVNVGAFMAPFISTAILGKPHSQEGWRNLFYACAGFTACNLLLLLTFKDVPSGASKTETPLQVLKRTIVNIFEPRLITWLLIMSCFWLMMYQLWDLHPNFITDWVDSSRVAAHVPQIWQEYGDRGLVQVPQQILLNLNAGLIIVLMVPLSWAARKMRTLSAMLVGMTVATCGILVAGLTGNGWILLLGIVFFSLGEMWTGPKKNEYLALIAPPGKKALYLGYVNIPVGIGLFVGSYMAGWLYNGWGEKATLALKELGARPELVARAAQSADWSDSLEKLPVLLDIERDQAFERACQHLGQDKNAAGETLRVAFRHDEGQITNLGYQYLAFHPKYANKVKAGLIAELREIADQLDPEKAKKDESSPAVEEPLTQPGDTPASLPTDLAERSDTLNRVERARVLLTLYQLLDSGKSQSGDVGIGRYVHRMPKWLGKKRVVVFELLRELINPEGSEANAKDDTEIVAMLWERFGDDPDVLNNLALEYLAQGTDDLRDAVANITFEHPPEELRKRIEEIEERIAIGRTKSFAALSAAMGADDQAEVDAAIAKAGAPDVYSYLAGLDHQRFLAVAKRDWTKDVALLRAMIESDASAKEIVEEHVWEKSWWERLTGFVKSLFGSEQREEDMYERLAGKQDVIQDALKAKDWSKTPEQAAQLLRLNPFEARALAGAEVNGAALKATHLLWDKYYPQYKVWIPFAAIGVVATIALGIFGQMAKRWKDMNA